MSNLPSKDAPPWSGQRSEFVDLWHGCTNVERQNIESIGVDLNHSRWDLDFSRGFYTTTSVHQAKRWAEIRFNSRLSKHEGNFPVVLRFQLRRHELAALHSLHFVRGTYDSEDFWSFIQHCRRSKRSNESSCACAARSPGPVTEVGRKWYDLVVGPVVANWHMRVAFGNSDQFGFHTPASLKLLNNAIKNHDSGRYTWERTTR